MAWQSQPPDPPQHHQARSANTGRGIAWLAIFLSLSAIAISTFVFLSTYDDGKFGEKLRERGSKLKENIQVLKDETASALKSRKEANAAEEAGNASADGGAEAKPGAAGGDVRWDKIQERIQKLRTMVSEGDDRAGSYLDKLRDDLSALRDYSTEQGQAMLEKASTELQSIRGTLKENAAEAGSKLKTLSEEIAPGEGNEEPPEAKAEEPDEAPKPRDESGGAVGADKRKGAKEPLPDLPPPPSPDEN